MELLLKKDVGGLGHEGDVVNVKSGFARNYLLPRGLATSVTPQARLELQAARSRREKARQAELERLGSLRSRIEALSLTIRKEGLIPALESTHAFVQAFKEAPKLTRDDVVVINQSGRGDKDIFTVADAFGDPKWKQFIRDKAEEYGA